MSFEENKNYELSYDLKIINDNSNNEINNSLNCINDDNINYKNDMHHISEDNEGEDLIETNSRRMSVNFSNNTSLNNNIKNNNYKQHQEYNTIDNKYNDNNIDYENTSEYINEDYDFNKQLGNCNYKDNIQDDYYDNFYNSEEDNKDNISPYIIKNKSVNKHLKNELNNLDFNKIKFKNNTDNISKEEGITNIHNVDHTNSYNFAIKKPIVKNSIKSMSAKNKENFDNNNNNNIITTQEDNLVKEVYKNNYKANNYNYSNNNITDMIKSINKQNSNNINEEGKKTNNVINERDENKMISMSNKNLSNRLPVEFELYDDATKRKEKLEKLDNNNLMEILINSSKHKISNYSYQLSVAKIEKKIDFAFEYVDPQKTGFATIFSLGEALFILNLFRETFNINFNNDNINNKNNTINTTINNLKNSKLIKNYSSYRDIQQELKVNKKAEIRKSKESLFIEQLWMILNPENDVHIRIDTAKEFLKILFSPLASSIKDMSDILDKFLQACFFLNNNNNNSNSNNNNNNNVKHISPITNKPVQEGYIWSLEKLVKEFLLLKENFLAYQGIGNLKQNTYNEYENKYKNFSFKPEINYHKSMDNNKMRKHFLERGSEFVSQKNENLKKLKDEFQSNELKNCTFKPEINYISNANKNDTNNNNSLNKDNSNKNIKYYDRLYNNHKKKLIDREKLASECLEELRNKDQMDCSFKPKINNFNRDKVFDNKMNARDLNTFNQTVERMRNGILQNFTKKYLSEKVTTGENWLKVKNEKIKPFNITDLKSKGYRSTNSNAINNDNISENNKEEQDEYFSIQITIPNGKERVLRISKYDDPEYIADNFCKIYGLKDEIKNRLIKTIYHFINLYLNKPVDESNNNNNNNSNINRSQLNNNNNVNNNYNNKGNNEDN